jgi:hypothetical protein
MTVEQVRRAAKRPRLGGDLDFGRDRPPARLYAATPALAGSLFWGVADTSRISAPKNPRAREALKLRACDTRSAQFETRASA